MAKSTRRKRTSKPLHVCVDRIVSPEHIRTAAQTALKENPANAPKNLSSTALAAAGRNPLSIAVLVSRRWEKGRTLKVRFLDGDAAQRRKVEEKAHEWEQFANITFKFGNAADAEIRISFQADPGSWSALGTDALVREDFPKDQPTMNFGWLTAESDDEEYSRVVLHEFGHALSAIHEHQSPAAGIKWNKPVVYRYYLGPPNNWTKEEVDFNLFQKYSRTLTNSTTFDPKSIMMYSFPREFTTNQFSAPSNAQLSAKDKAFIRKMYPTP